MAFIKALSVKASNPEVHGICETEMEMEQGEKGGGTGMGFWRRDRVDERFYFGRSLCVDKNVLFGRDMMPIEGSMKPSWG